MKYDVQGVCREFSDKVNSYLVGGLDHLDYFPFHIWDVIVPIDELIFFKMVIAPPTRYII